MCRMNCRAGTWIGIILVWGTLFPQFTQADTRFQDCAGCPEMINVPDGSFIMGSPSTEPQRTLAESPQREVNISKFALSVTEITFDQWDACVADGGCTHDPHDNDWGRGARPVINVNWNDAQEYVRWLSATSGESYRLPSEAEREYATRAGTTGRFNTGDCITTDDANFRGFAPATDCPGGDYREQTLPVGSFKANAWGLHDMHGNVWEWVQDCWNVTSSDAPTDGSAWMEGDCTNAVLRGGSWAFGGRGIRSAARARDNREVRNHFRGFRVARDLE